MASCSRLSLLDTHHPLARVLRPRVISSSYAWSNTPRRGITQTTRCKSPSTRHETHHHHQHNNRPDSESIFKPSFWASKQTWKRAAVNTTRCLVGCTSGDFSTMWLLQTYRPGLGMGTIMPISMTAGLATSLLLETVLLRFGQERLPWALAARTALGMSLFSMVAMETVQNIVDYHLTGGVVTLDDPKFWIAGAVSMAVGWLAPLPYNYVRLRRYGMECH